MGLRDSESTSRFYLYANHTKIYNLGSRALCTVNGRRKVVICIAEMYAGTAQVFTDAAQAQTY